MSLDAKEIERRNEIIQKLTYELPVLRARLGLSQAETAEKIGISRQTYCGIENGKKEMNWTMCIALFSIFNNEPETREMLAMFDVLNDQRDKENER